MFRDRKQWWFRGRRRCMTDILAAADGIASERVSALSLSLTHTLSLERSLSHSLFHSLSLSHFLTHSLSLSLSVSLSLPLSLSLSLPLRPCYSLTHSLSLSAPTSLSPSLNGHWSHFIQKACFSDGLIWTPLSK